MHKDTTIDSHIAAILHQSGLPLKRRAEVADELRCHLEQLIATKESAGLTSELAVEAALADFGSPQVIRKQLMKQQRKLDRRLALVEFRHSAKLLVGSCGFFAMVFALTAPGPGTFGPRCLVGVCLFVVMLLIASVPVYFAALLALPVQRQRPIAEYSFTRSFMRHAVVVCIYLGLTLTMAPLVIGFVGYIGQFILFQSIIYLAPGVIEGAPWLFWHNFGIVAWASPIRSFLVPLVMVIVSALAIALYERSRCVDVESFQTQE